MWRSRTTSREVWRQSTRTTLGFTPMNACRYLSTFQVIEVTRHGGSEVLEFKARDKSRFDSLEPAHICIRNAAAGVNFIDTYLREGKYPSNPPYVPGKEGAGEIVGVGEGVQGLSTGDRVAYFLPASIDGAYAEYISIPARYAVPVPKEVTLEQAAGVLLQGMTAHALIKDVYTIKPGDTMLVQAAAGGMGLLLCQLGKSFGARVIGTTSTAEKAKKALSAGAEEVIIYTECDFAERVRQITNGRGVNVVYDGVGKTTFTKSMECLKPRGMMVLYGAASGQPDPIVPASLGRASLVLTRPSLFHFVEGHEEYKQRAADVFDWLITRRISVELTSFPLAEAKAAHDALEGRKTTGKIILVP